MHYLRCFFNGEVSQQRAFGKRHLDFENDSEIINKKDIFELFDFI
jgi:hypothetical protein